ncbi:hypothetical protein RQP46_003859 [Phenoliferia psychrophenolica]
MPGSSSRGAAPAAGSRSTRFEESQSPPAPSPFQRAPASFKHRAASSASFDLSSGSLSSDQLENLRRQSSLSALPLSPKRPGTAQSGSTATQRPPRRASHLNRSFGSQADAGEGEEESIYTRDEDQDEDEDEFNLVDRMRNWRHDAMTQHLYSTANFWGSKIFGLTGNPNDAFWLAQCHFFTHQFAQAEKILISLRPPHGEPASSSAPATRLTDSSTICRYLAAQCQVRLGKWDDALDMVGRGGILGTRISADEEEPSDGGIKIAASTAHLRGLIHLHMGATDLAKDSFVEALSRDVKCFESFEMLVGSEMMSSDEEWEFIQGLRYQAQLGDDADFVRMMYTVRLKKIKHRDEMRTARRRLTEEYNLGDDPDVLFGLADELYTGMRILASHSSHRPTLPLHLACMHHLPNLRSRLYLLAQELVENEPDDAISWYAVGLWYFAGRRWEESRRYFGKSVLIDSRFGPAWIAFAHSYAYEGEHDQAITAYATALRHFQGTHLPLLFIGMQHLGLSNVPLAREYLEAARVGCPDDPLVLNELGVIAHHNGRFEDAITFFRQALALAKKVQGSPAAWATTHLNLGHAYRKLKRLPEAHTSFRQVIRLDPRSGGAYAALGLVEHQMGNYQESISRYHEALSIAPGDPVTCDLLRLVLEDTAFSISTEAFAFPGIPPAALRRIDQQVADLDASIAEGAPLPDGGGDEIALDQDDAGPQEEGESYGGDGEETMDMSG